MVHRDMQIAVIFGVEKYDVIVVDDWLTLLPIVIPLVEEERDALCRWLRNQFYLLATSIDL